VVTVRAWAMLAELAGAPQAIPSGRSCHDEKGCLTRCGSEGQIPGADRHASGPNGKVAVDAVVSRLPAWGGPQAGCS
jgi:hypothetical protein